MKNSGPNLINKQVGKYLIVNEISRGGMGVIFLGKHVTLNRYAAVKMLFPHLAGEVNFVKRFREEMKAMSKLKHPNIVDIYDYEEAYNTYFIIMEVVVGRSLDSMLKELGVLTSQTAVGIIRQVLMALNFAHQKGVLHRDIKPSNIMVNDQGLVKVLDFGIAKIIGGEHLTQTGFMVGTPQYVSPEQAKGEKLTPASDLYSASAVLFEMLTGEPVFNAETPVGIAMAHIKETPRKPRKLNPSIPASLEKLILRGLDKNPARRFKSAEEMINLLDKIHAPGDNGQAHSKHVKSAFKQAAPTVISDSAYSGDSNKETLVDDGGVVWDEPEDSRTILDKLSFFSRLSPQKIFGSALLLIVVLMTIWLTVSDSGRKFIADAFPSGKSLDATKVNPEVNRIVLPVSMDIPKKFGNIMGIDFIAVAKGKFNMGAKVGTTGSLDDSPVHEVRLDTFFISKYEITNAQYAMFINDTGHSMPATWLDGKFDEKKADFPVADINWYEASLFCRWLSGKTGLTFRLPTEAEWERAAYSGGKYPWGDKWRENAANTSEAGQKGPVAVGSYSDDRSLAGLFDVGGNVREWVHDYYSMSEYAVSRYDNPVGPRNGKKRVVRGGSFKTSSEYARITHRDSMLPRIRTKDLGFRIVMQTTNRPLTS